MRPFYWESVTFMLSRCGRRAHLLPYDLLYAKYPSSPLVLRDAHHLGVPHFKSVQRPVTRHPNGQLEGLFIDHV